MTKIKGNHALELSLASENNTRDPYKCACEINTHCSYLIVIWRIWKILKYFESTL